MNPFRRHKERARQRERLAEALDRFFTEAYRCEGLLIDPDRPHLGNTDYVCVPRTTWLGVLPVWEDYYQRKPEPEPEGERIPPFLIVGELDDDENPHYYDRAVPG